MCSGEQNLGAERGRASIFRSHDVCGSGAVYRFRIENARGRVVARGGECNANPKRNGKTPKHDQRLSLHFIRRCLRLVFLFGRARPVAGQSLILTSDF
jgi:hypothetical protein